MMRTKSGFGAAVLGCFLLGLGGCGHLRTKPADKYVYVTAKSTYLRDRVAAVSNRTGNVVNGDKLTVLDHARRFVKVRTAKGEVGWVDEKAVATQGVADAFQDLAKTHEKDPAVGAATVRDEVPLHVSAGRDSETFYRMQEGDKLSLLARATLAKPVPPGAAPAKTAVAPVKLDTKGKPAAEPEVPAGPVMEDWWLVRDGQGRIGWIYSRKIDVDAPEALARYAEGQRMVGAYVLAHVNDPESGMLKDGQPYSDIPVYVTVLGPYKAGLPYDFDQVRVFSWNLKKHRYETAMREKNVEGYLPVVVGTSKDQYGKGADAAQSLPSFTYKVLAAEAPAPSPDTVTGIVTPGKTVEKTYRLIGNITRRVVAPGAAPGEAHPVVEEKKDSKKKKKR